MAGPVSCAFFVVFSFAFSLLHQASSTGIFELKLTKFINNNGLRLSGNCCKSPSTMSCECKTFFRVCLTHYQTNITRDPPCTFGGVLTPVLGSNSFTIHDISNSEGFSSPIRFPFSFTWPGTFSLIIEAWSAESAELSTEVPERLISRLATQRHLSVTEEWSQDIYFANSAELHYSYRVICDEHYYGSGCSMLCRPRDDGFGHFTCGDAGKKLCLPGWTGPYCEKAMCLPGCSKTQGDCDRPGECKCRLGWEGRYCDQCIRFPGCKHGTCQQPWKCKCQEGWGGLFCNLDLNYCTNHNPCKNAATCTNTGQGSYSCTCRPGFSGTNCEVELNECDTRPCRNGGSCTDLENDYKCMCLPGFHGKNCELSANTCADAPCFHGGQCLNRLQGGYNCQCLSGYTGYNCEKRDHCSSNPCAYGGQCLNLESTFRCHCRPGFAGIRCERTVNNCVSFPCLHGGTCHPRGNDFVCSCPIGYLGKDCSFSAHQCSSGPCYNGGTCRPQPDGGYACECPVGYEGPDCGDLLSPPIKVNILPPKMVVEQNFPWLAVTVGLALVFVLLLLAVLILLWRRLRGGLAAGPDHSEGKTMNNLSDFHREKELAVNLIPAGELKNTNKQVDLEGDGSSLKTGYKLKYQDMDYNIILDPVGDEVSDNEKSKQDEEISDSSSSSDIENAVACRTPQQDDCVIATEV
uniref:delta-like protein 1 n=1 Tax=Myxine glutinosa TaxID=7769 RepID=UPI00358EDFA3